MGCVGVEKDISLQKRRDTNFERKKYLMEKFVATAKQHSLKIGVKVHCQWKDRQTQQAPGQTVRKKAPAS